MTSLFVTEDDKEDEDVIRLLTNQDEAESVQLNERDTEDKQDEGRIPIAIEEPKNEPVYKTREVRCSLPLRFQQEIIENLLLKDGLLILGKGLGWETITANLLHALSFPNIELHRDGIQIDTKRNLILLLNASDQENIKLGEILRDLNWIECCNDNKPTDALNLKPLTTIKGEAMTAERRKRVYKEGGIVSISSRVLVVDLLSEALPANDIAGIFILHAERVKETSTESFVVSLYRDNNEWGFLKAVSDIPGSFTGFTPLASKLKALRLKDTFLWPRFHVKVSASLNLKGVGLLKRQKQKLQTFSQVIEINTKLTYKMNKVQSAILSCIQACLLELKRHNPLLANEYWDVENLHDTEFIGRIRISLDAHWHRISWTSKQLINDLSTLKDLLGYLLSKDSVTFYQIVQEIVVQSVKTKIGGSFGHVSMSPWLNLDEATTIVSYAKERAFGKVLISPNDPMKSTGLDAEDTGNDRNLQEVYNLEELPKWNQLQVLIDDILFEKSQEMSERGPLLIMCSGSSTVEQLSKIIDNLSKKAVTADGRKYYNNRDYMVGKLHNYLEWKNFASLAKRINSELEDRSENENNEKSDGAEKNESLQISKTFSRGKGTPLSKRRRTRGASSVASVNSLYSGSSQGKTFETVNLDDDIMARMAQEPNNQNEVSKSLANNNQQDDVEEESAEEIMSEMETFEWISTDEQIVIQAYDERYDDALLEEIYPSHIIMYDPNLLFIRRVEIYQAINQEKAARVFFMYYGSSEEEQMHLLSIKKEKEAFTKVIREKASLAKHYFAPEENNKFRIRREEVLNTRIAGGSRFRTEDDDMKVIVDVREFRSSLPNLIYRAGMKVIPCMLTVGDYVLSPKICVERKSIPDLISSFKSGRLYMQCEQMFRFYELPTLLIEFDENKSFSLEPFSETKASRTAAANPVASKLLQQDIQSKIMMLLVSFPKLKIIWSSSPYETAQIIFEIKASQEEPDIASAISKGLDPTVGLEEGDPPLYNDDAIDLIQNIPGINNANYYAIINKVRSIEELVELPELDFVNMLGVESGRKAFRFINENVK